MACGALSVADGEGGGGGLAVGRGGDGEGLAGFACELVAGGGVAVGVGEEEMDGLSYLDTCEASDKAQEKKPSLIILDFNMPKKDGREALEEIKTHPKRKNIPVIVLTTSQADSDIDQAYQLGANSFIQKPFKYVDFKATMEVLQEYWLNIVKLPS